jgi:hypothetical protein
MRDMDFLRDKYRVQVGNNGWPEDRHRCAYDGEVDFKTGDDKDLR